MDRRTAGKPATSGAGAARWRSRLGALGFWGGVALLLGWNFPYHPWLQHANELPRIFTTMALVEEGHPSIDTYRRLYGYRKTMDLSRSLCLTRRVGEALVLRGVDAGGRHHAWRPRPGAGVCRERTFSNKAPGQSLLAVPAYGVLHWVWGRSTAPASVRDLGSGARGAGRVGAVAGRRPGRRAVSAERARRLRQAIWAARWTTATVPAFLFLLLLSWWLRPVVRDRLSRRGAVVCYGLGTLAFTYSVQFMSHQLAAALLFGAFIAVHAVARRGAHGAWLLVAGLAGGSAIACDYQMVFGAALVAGYALLVLRPWPRLALGLLGAVPPVAALLYYHHAAFGAVHWTGYEFLLAQGDQALHHRGFLGMSGPRAEAFWGSFFAPDNGLYYFSPWLIVALGALLWLGWQAWRRRGGAAGLVRASGSADLPPFLGAAEVLLFASWIAVYTLFLCSLTFWRGGWQTGPRYVAGMLPVFVLPYGLLLTRLRSRPVARALALAPGLFAVGVYAVIVTGFPHFPEKFHYPLFDLVRPLWLSGHVSENLGHALLGLGGYGSLAPYVGVLGLILLYLAGGPGLFGLGPARASGRDLTDAGDAADARERPPELGDPSDAAAVARLHWGLALSGLLTLWGAAGLYVGYGRTAAQGMRRAWNRPVRPGVRETYGAFLRRAHRDISRNWFPPLRRGPARGPTSVRRIRGAP